MPDKIWLASVCYGSTLLPHLTDSIHLQLQNTAYKILEVLELQWYSSAEILAQPEPQSSLTSNAMTNDNNPMTLKSWPEIIIILEGVSWVLEGISTEGASTLLEFLEHAYTVWHHKGTTNPTPHYISVRSQGDRMKEKKDVQSEEGTDKKPVFRKETKQVGKLFGFERSQHISRSCNLKSMKCWNASACQHDCSCRTRYLNNMNFTQETTPRLLKPKSRLIKPEPHFLHCISNSW